MSPTHRPLLVSGNVCVQTVVCKLEYGCELVTEGPNESDRTALNPARRGLSGYARIHKGWYLRVVSKPKESRVSSPNMELEVRIAMCQVQERIPLKEGAIRRGLLSAPVSACVLERVRLTLLYRRPEPCHYMGV